MRTYALFAASCAALASAASIPLSSEQQVLGADSQIVGAWPSSEQKPVAAKELFRVEVEPGKFSWVTEDEKWAMRRVRLS